MIPIFEPVQVISSGLPGWVTNVRGGPNGIREYLVEAHGGVSEWCPEEDLTLRVRPVMPSVGSIVTCYAQKCEVIRHDYERGTIDLMAPMMPNKGNVERLHFYAGTPQAHLAIWHGEISQLMDVTTICDFADGETDLALPDWVRLNFTATAGDWATIEGGDLHVRLAGDALVTFQITVAQKASNYAIFGYGWDGAEPLEFGRIQLLGNAANRYTMQRTVQVPEDGHMLAFYITSNDASKTLTWSEGELVIS